MSVPLSWCSRILRAARWVAFSSITVCCVHAGLLRLPGVRALPRCVVGVGVCLALSSSARMPANLRFGIFLDFLPHCGVRLPGTARAIVAELAHGYARRSGVLEGLEAGDLSGEYRNAPGFEFLAQSHPLGFR